ncbi:hypothetical protein [Thalassospira xiamenensis]|uniref:GIY-YIG domain-containing protein n=1 Tax=Thalassospira xiamenensis TaxID=220697 RepID=A0A285TXZ7_9PROT|nr:hypothetical protein [Thalassospira xiamenensis]SOC30352.1 hypothetical protein SAMN05428964_10916 [Thalassospira xiamenensis]
MSAKGQKFILNQRWFEHLSPREFHAHFRHFDHLFRVFLGRHKDFGLKLDIHGMAGAPIKVKVGDPEPTIHLVAIKNSGKWTRFYIPPSRLSAVPDDARVSTMGQNVNIADSGYVFVHPLLRFEVVTDPYIAEQALSPKNIQAARTCQDAPPFEPGAIRTPSQIFSTKLEYLVTTERVHGKGARLPQYFLYEHMFGNEHEYPFNGLFYVGITRRSWKKRWSEHRAAIERGSRLKFHQAFRERRDGGRLSHIHHYVLAVLDDLDTLCQAEQSIVAGHWHDTRLLNMIPGGHEGLRYLRQRNIVGDETPLAPEDRERTLENWMQNRPIAKALNERWLDPDWAAAVVCAPANRFSIEDVCAIRELAATGLPLSEIASRIGCDNLTRVRRVISGQTYQRVQLR